MPSFHLEDVKTQEAALGRMMDLVAGALSKPGTGAQLVQVARAITSDCAARDDRCEDLHQLRIPELLQGVRDLADRVARVGDFQQIRLQATGLCSTAAMAQLLYSIETAQIPMKINEFRLTSRKEGSDDLTFALSVSTIVFSPTGLGYWL